MCGTEFLTGYELTELLPTLSCYMALFCQHVTEVGFKWVAYVRFLYISWCGLWNTCILITGRLWLMLKLEENWKIQWNMQQKQQDNKTSEMKKMIKRMYLLYKSNYYDILSSSCTNEFCQKYLNCTINTLKRDF